ncbi:uncharacterized protein LOC130990897 [Salvia miltiorrhiza]|uniref:uncharacterized protein LOC130990897 n=1 Tax=Salvia miltiorrhiza TaxID=226208 RepID=UPI0025AD2182|nr:uncharacterized protein LOC130990897 [Salvia miltiorrhiza]
MASNSVQEGSNDVTKGKVSKPEKTRRSWSRKEEEILLASLKELVVNGWKADNGFRAGYLTKLEESMRREFPDTDIKGMPHINSKISAWKKSYGSLSLMLGNSGAGFNLKGTFMIDCNNDTWEQIVKKDNNALKMRYKSWPMFDDWKDIFGKDRATGEQTEDLMEAIHAMYAADNMAQDGGDTAFNPAEGDAQTEEEDASVCQSGKIRTGAGGSKKKRKTRSEVDVLCAALGEVSKNANDRLESLATRIGYEWDLGQARQAVYEKLGQIPGLSLKDKFVVCEMLADKVQLLEIFIGLPEDAKAAYVAYLLESSLT